MVLSTSRLDNGNFLSGWIFIWTSCLLQSWWSSLLQSGSVQTSHLNLNIYSCHFLNTVIKNFSSFYVSTFRMAWAMGLAWVLFAAEFGYCPPIKWGLSLYIWNLIGKLSYAIYLVHIYVYTLYYFQTRQGMGIKGDDSDDKISHAHLKLVTNINCLQHRCDPI